jgi:hypothetical protein
MSLVFYFLDLLALKCRKKTFVIFTLVFEPDSALSVNSDLNGFIESTPVVDGVDHNFLRFLSIFGEQIGVFLKTQLYYHNLAVV